MAEIRKHFNSDFSIEQNWQDYSEEEHAIWRLLFERQQRPVDIEEKRRLRVERRRP